MKKRTRWKTLLRQAIKLAGDIEQVRITRHGETLATAKKFHVAFRFKKHVVKVAPGDVYTLREKHFSEVLAK